MEFGTYRPTAKLRWREATFDEEEQYPCVDYGRRLEVPGKLILEQLWDDGIWRPVEIEHNPLTP